MVRLRQHRDTAVCQFVLIADDDVIAGILNRNALKTGNGNRWTRERVTSMRSNYRIPVFKPAEDGIEPWLNLSNAAKLLQIAPKTLRLAAEAGEIEAIHPLPDGPWIFARAALTTSAARSITERARQNPRYPAGSHPQRRDRQSHAPSGCSRTTIERFYPHPPHQRFDMPTADLAPLGSQQAPQHPRTGEGELQMQPVETPHDRNIGVRHRARQVVDTATADAQNLRLLGPGRRARP